MEFQDQIISTSILSNTDNLWDHLELPIEDNNPCGGSSLNGKKSSSLLGDQSVITTHGKEDNSLSTLIQDLYHLWSLPEETNCMSLVPNRDEETSNGGLLDFKCVHDQENALATNEKAIEEEEETLSKNRFNCKTRRKRNDRLKCLEAGKKVVEPKNAIQGSSVSKKQDHNAKERVRRMKLNASYLALGSLIPYSRRSKKRRSAPFIIDKVLDYIPELEKEIEILDHKKSNLVLDAKNTQTTLNLNMKIKASPTVSLHEMDKGQVIIQTCSHKDKQNVLSNVISEIEAEGMSIVSASTLQVCDERVCYHLHVQMNAGSLEADYLSLLRAKVISWLH